MKYFVQYNSKRFWENSWNFKFVIYDYETKIRTYISPSSSKLKTDEIWRPHEHEANQKKVVTCDN